MIPGVGDTFRVNGRAIVTDDAELLAPCGVGGKVPRLGILVSVQEAYTQCPKAFIRSRLWDPATQIERAALPSSGEILRSLVADSGDEFDGERYDRERAAR